MPFLPGRPAAKRKRSTVANPAMATTCKPALTKIGLVVAMAVPLSAGAAEATSTFAESKKMAAAGGDPETITRLLETSLADGSFRFFELKYGASFGALRSAHWTDVMDRLGATSPWIGDFDAFLSGNQSFPRLLWRTEHWDRRIDRIPPDVVGTFRQYAGVTYSFAGDYLSAELIYPAETKVSPPGELGYTSLVPALEPIIQASHGRRAVLLNESHGRAETRAANFLLIRRLIDEGFTHLAFEGVSTVTAGNGCDEPADGGTELARRGHVVEDDGYYTDEPIFAETIRYALARGVTVIGYDTTDSGASMESREEHQATQLACVLAADPSARLIVVGGFAHISERADNRIHGGMMGRRLADKAGIDPLTVESTILLKFALTRRPEAESGSDQIFMLQRPDGETFAVDGYDFTLVIRPIGSRGRRNAALELGGHRSAVFPADVTCTQPPCLFEAVLTGATESATPLDRCLTRSAGVACPLFVPSVPYTVRVREGEHFQRSSTSGD